MSEENAQAKPELSLEVKKYNEEMCEKYGLPSPFKTARLKQICEEMVQSGMVPQHFNNNPMAMLFACQRGAELGLDPYESVLESFWAMPQRYKDRATGQWMDRGMVLGLYANKMADLLHRKGIRTKYITETAEKCEILFSPPESSGHEPYTSIFTFAEAKTAELVKEGGNWVKWPRAMCRARAIAIGWRAMGGIIGKGANLYAKEELEDEFETVAPATESTPEVQQERPATASRKPKEKTIEVKSEVVTETSQTNSQSAPQQPQNTAQPEEPKPVPTDTPKKNFYVISSAATLPALDKVEEAPIRKLKLASHTTTDIAEAMKQSDKITRDSEVPHYVLTFDDGKAKVLHTSKLDKSAPPAEQKRMYIVVPESAVRTATSDADVENAKTNPPHENLTTCEMLAQAKATATGESHYVVFKNANGKYEDAFIARPPQTNGAQTKPAEQPKTDTPEEQELRQELSAKLKTLVAAVQGVPEPQKRQATINAYLVAYRGLTTIKDLAKDLPRAKEAVLACEKDLAAHPVDFAANAVTLGNAARQRNEAYAPMPEQEKPADVPAMAKYYADRGWNGTTTSLAEVWRRNNNLGPEQFEKAMEYSGIKLCGDRDAAAYFSVATIYGKELSARFAIEIKATEYHAKLTEIRDRFDGAELKAIPEVKFSEALDKVLAGEPVDLFAGQ